MRELSGYDDYSQEYMYSVSYCEIVIGDDDLAIFRSILCDQESSRDKGFSQKIRILADSIPGWNYPLGHQHPRPLGPMIVHPE